MAAPRRPTSTLSSPAGAGRGGPSSYGASDKAGPTATPPRAAPSSGRSQLLPRPSGVDQARLPGDAAERLNGAGARLTCVVNPHAPSGVLTPADAIERLAEALDGVLLVDEAYVDFVDPARQHDLTPLVRRHANLLLLRTFSKGYSLAGLRLGYLLGHPGLIEPMLTKTRDSYNVDAISQALGDAAAADQDYARRTWDAVRTARAALAGGLAQLGIASVPSESNFLLAKIPPAAGITARDLYQRLKDGGILVRYFAAPRLDDCLRISVGTPEQNQRLIEAVTEAIHDRATD